MKHLLNFIIGLITIILGLFIICQPYLILKWIGSSIGIHSYIGIVISECFIIMACALLYILGDFIRVVIFGGGK